MVASFFWGSERTSLPLASNGNRPGVASYYGHPPPSNMERKPPWLSGSSRECGMWSTHLRQQQEREQAEREVKMEAWQTVAGRKGPHNMWECIHRFPMLLVGGMTSAISIGRASFWGVIFAE